MNKLMGEDVNEARKILQKAKELLQDKECIEISESKRV